MPGALNKANARRNIKTKARSNRAAKERRTQEHKKNRLVRHLKAHTKDRTAYEAMATLQDGHHVIKVHRPNFSLLRTEQKVRQVINA